MTTRKITVNQIELAYNVDGDGLPIILLHGNGEDKSIFTELSKSLSDKYTVYSIDSRCHGESSSASLTYDDMAEDIHAFIEAMHLKNVGLLGFSDGGIVALKLAIKYPKLIEKYFVLGANINPKGLSVRVRFLYRIAYFLFRDPKIGLMLKEPHITNKELNSIQDSCIIIAGEKDVIYLKHTQNIADNIKLSKLIIVPKHTHTSYVIHNDMLSEIVKNF